MQHEDLAIKNKLQQSAPTAINMQKAVSAKFKFDNKNLYTNDLFDNVLNMDEEEERR